MFAGIVETLFAEYLSSLTDVPATLETADRDSAGKVMHDAHALSVVASSHTGHAFDCMAALHSCVYMCLCKAGVNSPQLQSYSLMHSNSPCLDRHRIQMIHTCNPQVLI